jgi:5,6-dimethylbenzimidazole synthase
MRWPLTRVGKAHRAPSVGFMQPWNFLVVGSPADKPRVHDVFRTAEAEGLSPDDRRALYSRMKPQEILELPINQCITCDRSRSGPVVLGRTHMLSMGLYSSVCAVQNLWLAARAEGLGVGWVSIFEQQALQDALGIPHDIVPIACLCVGWVSHFNNRPELETCGWLPRLPLAELLHYEQWGSTMRTSPDEALTAAACAQRPRTTAFHRRPGSTCPPA